jgi:phage-related protein
MIVGAIAAFAGAKIATLGFVAGLKATAGAIGTALTAIGGIIASIVTLPVVIAGVVVALAAFVLAYRKNWFGVRDITDRVVDKIVKVVKRGFKLFINKAVEFLKAFVKKAKKKFGKLRDNTVETFNNLVSDATQFGKDLVSNFASGIRDKISAATAAASELASKVRERLPSSPAQTGPLSDLDKTGPGMVDTFTAGVSDGMSRIDSNLGEDSTNASTTGKALARNNGRTIIEIEGRQVERATRDFRSDGTDLRGRYG